MRFILVTCISLLAEENLVVDFLLSNNLPFLAKKCRSLSIATRELEVLLLKSFDFRLSTGGFELSSCIMVFIRSGALAGNKD